MLAPRAGDAPSPARAPRPCGPTGARKARPRSRHPAPMTTRTQSLRALSVPLLLLATACASSKTATVRELQRLKEAGELERAQALIAPDARVWFEERAGEGAPWSAAGGPWSAWDRHFRARATYTDWEEAEDRVSVTALESNDFYRAIERPPTPVRLTWFFDEDGRIEGLFVRRPPGVPIEDRFEQFRAWAEREAPEETAALMPGGSIDPSGDHPARFELLLARWRAETGRPPLLPAPRE